MTKTTSKLEWKVKKKKKAWLIPKITIKTNKKEKGVV
jgi:hypothetical protein